jgi:tyrosyl-tRNA synthetase
MPGLFADLTWRGLVYQMTDPALESILETGSLTAYIGFDPSADSLHAGNLLQLVNLARLQRAGHRAIVLAGGATGMIGDPGGRSSERNLLDVEQLRANVEAVLPQLRQFMEFGGSNPATLVNNYDWTSQLVVIDFLRDVGKHFTINQLVTRDSVRNRMDSEHGISFTEFSYGLLQANDYWHLFKEHGCTLQLGGSDQWANILGGVDLIRRREGAQAFGMSTPLVTKADGTKFGKSVGGAVWLDPKKTSPYAFYQFFLNVEDAKVIDYLKFFTLDLTHDEIGELETANAERPHARDAHRALARSLTKLVHGESELHNVEAASKALFDGDLHRLDEQMLLQVLAEVPSVTVARTDNVVVDLLVAAKLVNSKADARRAVEQGGVTVNARKVDSFDAEVSDLLHGKYAVLRKGKRHYALVHFV